MASNMFYRPLQSHRHRPGWKGGNDYDHFYLDRLLTKDGVGFDSESASESEYGSESELESELELEDSGAEDGSLRSAEQCAANPTATTRDVSDHANPAAAVAVMAKPARQGAPGAARRQKRGMSQVWNHVESEFKPPDMDQGPPDTFDGKDELARQDLNCAKSHDAAFDSAHDHNLSGGQPRADACKSPRPTRSSSRAAKVHEAVYGAGGKPDKGDKKKKVDVDVSEYDYGSKAEKLARQARLEKLGLKSLAAMVEQEDAPAWSSMSGKWASNSLSEHADEGPETQGPGEAADGAATADLGWDGNLKAWAKHTSAPADVDGAAEGAATPGGDLEDAGGAISTGGSPGDSSAGGHAPAASEEDEDMMKTMRQVATIAQAAMKFGRKRNARKSMDDDSAMILTPQNVLDRFRNQGGTTWAKNQLNSLIEQQEYDADEFEQKSELSKAEFVLGWLNQQNMEKEAVLGSLVEYYIMTELLAQIRPMVLQASVTRLQEKQQGVIDVMLEDMLFFEMLPQLRPIVIAARAIVNWSKCRIKCTFKAIETQASSSESVGDMNDYQMQLFLAVKKKKLDQALFQANDHLSEAEAASLLQALEIYSQQDTAGTVDGALYTSGMDAFFWNYNRVLHQVVDEFVQFAVDDQMMMFSDEEIAPGVGVRYRDCVNAWSDILDEVLAEYMVKMRITVLLPEIEIKMYYARLRKHGRNAVGTQHFTMTALEIDSTEITSELAGTLGSLSVNQILDRYSTIPEVDKRRYGAYFTIHAEYDRALQDVGLTEAAMVESVQRIISDNPFNGHDKLSDEEIQYLLSMVAVERRADEAESNPNGIIQARQFFTVAALAEKMTDVTMSVSLMNEDKQQDGGARPAGQQRSVYNCENVGQLKDKMKSMWILNSPNSFGCISLSTLEITLRAGRMDRDNIRRIIDHFRSNGRDELDILDFVAYMPLFHEIHVAVMDAPLNAEARALDAVSGLLQARKCFIKWRRRMQHRKIAREMMLFKPGHKGANKFIGRLKRAKKKRMGESERKLLERRESLKDTRELDIHINNRVDHPLFADGAGPLSSKEKVKLPGITMLTHASSREKPTEEE